MISRVPIRPDRLRSISEGSFAFIHHRFLQDGFFASLNHLERSLYLFLLLAADRHGISFYSYERICSVLEITVDQYIAMRNALIEMELLAFDGRRFQVLSLPNRPLLLSSRDLRTQQDVDNYDPATIRRIIDDAPFNK